MAQRSHLLALSELISSSAQALDLAYAKQGLIHPSLNDPTFISTPLEDDPALKEARSIIIAAAMQLVTTVRSAPETMFHLAAGFHVSSSLEVAVECDFADILEGGGEEGLHSREVAAKAGIDESKTDRVLRLLAMSHVFKEITPNVFANNRLSSLLLKGKAPDELKANPVGAYDTAPVAALVGFATDQVFKSAPYLSQFIKENKADVQAPFSLAHNTTGSVWDWLELPGNEMARRRFNIMMKSNGEEYDPAPLVRERYWGHLTENDVVVDVGGNIGNVTLRLARAFSKPRFIVQDLEKAIKGSAQEYWAKEYPEAIERGRVQLQGTTPILVHSFFERQPVKGAAVYIVRFVLHDWAREECKKILNHIRAAASPESKLLVFDSIMPHACLETSPYVVDAARVNAAPYPLLASYGAGKGLWHSLLDLHMMTLMNGQERTIEEFVDLGTASGWKLESVDFGGGIPSRMGGMLFSPSD